MKILVYPYFREDYLLVAVLTEMKYDLALASECGSGLVVNGKIN